MQKRRKLIVGNWKMGPRTPEEAKLIFSKIKRAVLRLRKTEVVICPSHVHLPLLTKLSSRTGVSLGVQDVFWEAQGSFTGEISAAMAKNAGAAWVIVGHSERRMLGDTNSEVALKFEACLREGLSAIVCVGEKTRDRNGAFYEELKVQILETFSHAPKALLARKAVIAYEPLWAIGRSDFQAMKPSDIHETSIFIRKVINDAFGASVSELPILYGGSVSPENAWAIVHESGVDGLLVGRQSLLPQAFCDILTSVEKGHAKR